MRKCREIFAVTLVEVLVSCAIVMALAGIASTVYIQGKAAARETTAISVLKQTSAALLIYQADHQGMPDPQPLLAGSWLAPVGLWKGGRPVLKDPTFTQVRSSLVDLPGYAMNACLGAHTVTHPADTVLVATVGEFAEVNADGSQSELNVMALMTVDEVQYGEFGRKEAKKLGRDIVSIQEFGSRRHRGKGIYAFCDGRAKVVAAEQFVYPTQSYMCWAGQNVTYNRPLPGLGFMPVRPD